MTITLELALVMLLLLGLGVWGVVSGVRAARENRQQAVTPQELSALAQPFRRLLGEAVAIHKDLDLQAHEAPTALRQELLALSRRLERLIREAVPRARHGSRLAAFLLELGNDDPQRPRTEASIVEVTRELEGFVATLQAMRGKVYQILTDASALAIDSDMGSELEEALSDVEAMEEAFEEARNDFSSDFG